MIGTILHSVGTLPIVILFMVKVSESQEYHSGCPDILSYRLNRLLEGHIVVPRPQYNIDYEMEIHYCVPYDTVEVPASSRFTINTDSTRNLKYTAVFPFKNPQPFIESITFNGEVVCRESKDYGESNKCFWISNVMRNAPPRNCGRAVTSGGPTGPGIERGEWPWAVGIFRQWITPSLIHDSHNVHCGGSLVNEKHILSSADCFDVDVIKYYFIKIGAHDVSRVFEEHTEIVGISAVVTHPTYDPRSLDRNIAIVTLSRDVKFTSYIQPVCLWDTKNDKPDKATIISWRHRKENLTAAYAQKRTVSLVPCGQSDFVYVNTMSWNNKVFCAGDQQEDLVSRDDRGSGMYIKDDETWVLRGIISYINERVRGVGQTVFYTDLAEYKQWILENI